MQLRSVIALATLAFLAGCSGHRVNSLSTAEQREGWELLFDGETLDGWTTLGDRAAWVVRDGEITTTGSGNGWWLRTTRMYRDFDLMLEFNVPPKGNSGVGLRGSSVDDPAFTGVEVQILDSFGQAPTNANCGAVYEAIAPSRMAVRPAGEWNTYRIRLVGDTLDVWLNGEQVQRAEKLDGRGYYRKPENPLPMADRLTTGYIAIQDHGDPVRFRSIRIRDLSSDKDPGDFEALFNGRDLSGWHASHAGVWSVEEGTLVGRDGSGHLFSDAAFSDIEFRAFVKTNTRGNSGMYFRTVPNPDASIPWPVGYEAQVDNHDPKNFTGCIYDRAWGGKLITRDNAWFDYRVRAVGDRIQTWVNGVPMVDARLTDFQSGHLALQAHHPGNVIMYRDVQFRIPTRAEASTK